MSNAEYARLPPGPRVPVALQTLLLFRRPFEYLTWCRRRYGDVFTARAAPYGPIVYLASTDAVREVFTAPPGIFCSGAANDVLTPLFGENSLFLLDGEEHLRERKLMLPPFHGSTVRHHEVLMEEIAAENIERWPVGRPFALRPYTQALSLEVILRAVIGAAGPRLDELRARLPRLLDLSPVIMAMWLRPELERFGPWRRHVEEKRRVDALLLEEVRERRAGGGAGADMTALSMLVEARDPDGRGIGDEELRDELMTLLLAGHETVATGLAWAFERLLRTPAVMARALAAADEGDDAYLDAVVRETLRSRTLVLDVMRRVMRPAEVQGHPLPVGVIVAPSILLIHNDPRYHPQPHEFRPERFLDREVPPYSWLPYGGGLRRCVGATFSLVEMRIAVREILRRVELALPTPRPERQRMHHITLVPHQGGRVIVARRRRLRRRAGAEGRLAAVSAEADAG